MSLWFHFCSPPLKVYLLNLPIIFTRRAEIFRPENLGKQNTENYLEWEVAKASISECYRYYKCFINSSWQCKQKKLLISSNNNNVTPFWKLRIIKFRENWNLTASILQQLLVVVAFSPRTRLCDEFEIFYSVIINRRGILVVSSSSRCKRAAVVRKLFNSFAIASTSIGFRAHCALSIRQRLQRVER